MEWMHIPFEHPKGLSTSSALNPSMHVSHDVPVTNCFAGALSAGLVALVRPSETASRITAAGQAASGEEDEKRWGGLHEEQWREGEKMVETKNRGKERGGIIICINF